MTKKRKPVKPRGGVTSTRNGKKKIGYEVWVGPAGPLRWGVSVNTETLAKFLQKKDAMLVGKFIRDLLVSCGQTTEFFEIGRNGEIQDRSTLPRSADPHPPEG